MITKHYYADTYRILHICWTDENGNHTRATYAPGSDITHLPQEHQDAAAAMWTQEVIDAYKAAQKQAI